MDRPLDIGFHNMPSSADVEADIRRHVERLEKRHPHLIGCRVTVEALHNQHKTGNLHEVHITLSIPGKDLAVSHEPHHARENYAHPSLQTSIKDAFQAAERQLASAKGAH